MEDGSGLLALELILRTFYRVFNPWLQIDKFDEDCIYTKKWLPVFSRHSYKAYTKMGQVS